MRSHHPSLLWEKLWRRGKNLKNRNKKIEIKKIEIKKIEIYVFMLS